MTDIVDGASKPLGAHMAVLENGRYCGLVSGGCVEAAVAREAIIALANGNDHICRFGKGSPYFDIVLPCGGGIGLTIHVMRDPDPIAALLAGLADRRPGTLTYDICAHSLTFRPGLAATGWHGSLFNSSYRAETAIVLSGEGVEAKCFEAIASAAGLDVIPAETALNFLDGDPEQAFVLLHHDIARELPVLRAALATQAFFIGCLGSRRTHETRRHILLEEGYTEEQVARIHAPVGLFGPAREARGVAVSVLAEIISLIEARRGHPV
ncbi:hypothetical protein C241_16618 [Bradyrhizobium lupini HPC(L)]|uniref:Xanthine dehydrogenase accessory factor n=1 Tax=Bradyrhizobium lupini HPC(L) TaxID=1229491 RepID=A0ABP2RR67_RHILU|nr:hypothetical protein C241_16618 [Bradyrhizobium lupini HPC(L)]